ncbi:GNAT family N-acetyltransferase [Yersinia aldovae]|uniref:GNAT family N-acetyltransferase n=1 Tax=Yersinia aldovae TaxID=29483 RepID=UPI0011A53940
MCGAFYPQRKIPFYEIGYWLTSASIGKCFATEAVNQLKTFAFTTLNAKRLEIRMSGSHSKSRNVAIRGGFQLEAQLCCDRINPDGSLDNTCIFSIVN